LNFGIGDPNSTSGFLVPMSYIFAARKIEPKTCFKTVRNASHEANDMAVAHKQIDVATTNDKSLRRLEMTTPDARKDIRVIWTSPLIANDPVVWRRDLPADIKKRIYTWHLSYGRIGTPDEIVAARKVLADMLRAPYSPTNDDQLLPIRILEANKDIMKLQADDKLSAEEKVAKISPLQAEIKKYQAQADKAEHSKFKKQVEAFLEADKAGNQAELKRMIVEFAADFSGAPSN
jgi:phosphonate transport system substrate-binding protein